MNRLFQVVWLGGILLASVVIVSAQTTAQIESDLLRGIKAIQDSSAYRTERNEKRLEKANAAFKNKMLRYTKLPATLRYGFPKLGKQIYISTSADNKFRIYSWDREDGGTMHFFENVYQYLGDGKRVYSKSYKLRVGDADGFIADIFSMDTKAGKVYLACFSSILSTSQMAQSVNLFKIRANALDNNVRLIKTAKHLANTLGFEYDFFSVVDRAERPIKLISYDPATRSIKLPVVIVEDKFQYGRVTKRFIAYRFNGTYFEKVR